LENREVARSTSSKILAKIRQEKIGFIFQTFNLLSRTSVLNNVVLPAIYSGLKNRKEKAKSLVPKPIPQPVPVPITARSMLPVAGTSTVPRTVKEYQLQ
jgi:ABC-type transporter Mla maintaining outer membrane lipid asymmetry ATPase subunit MlaF